MNNVSIIRPGIVKNAILNRQHWIIFLTLKFLIRAICMSVDHYLILKKIWSKKLDKYCYLGYFTLGHAIVSAWLSDQHLPRPLAIYFEDHCELQLYRYRDIAGWITSLPKTAEDCNGILFGAWIRSLEQIYGSMK